MLALAVVVAPAALTALAFVWRMSWVVAVSGSAVVVGPSGLPDEPLPDGADGAACVMIFFTTVKGPSLQRHSLHGYSYTLFLTNFLVTTIATRTALPYGPPGWWWLAG
jgi:hypothetical protein